MVVIYMYTCMFPIITLSLRIFILPTWFVLSFFFCPFGISIQSGKLKPKSYRSAPVKWLRYGREKETFWIHITSETDNYISDGWTACTFRITRCLFVCLLKTHCHIIFKYIYVFMYVYAMRLSKFKRGRMPVYTKSFLC